MHKNIRNAQIRIGFGIFIDSDEIIFCFVCVKDKYYYIKVSIWEFKERFRRIIFAFKKLKLFTESISFCIFFVYIQQN